MYRIRQEELIYLLQNLLSHRLIEHSLYLSTLSIPSAKHGSSPPLDSSLPLPQLIRSALLRSPLAHLYELHPLFTKLLNLSIKSPSITSAYIPYRNLRSANMFAGLPEGFVRRKIGGKMETEGGDEIKRESSDVVVLVIACLELIGSEIGAGRL